MGKKKAKAEPLEEAPRLTDGSEPSIPPRLELMDIDALRPAPRNPKSHDIELLRRSISDDGFCDPPTLDERTGTIVEGHGRVEALKAMRAAGESTPKHVHLGPRGEWLVPVQRGIRFETDAARERYLLRHNRLTEVGGWDSAMLADVLTDLRNRDLDEGLGWSSKDLDKVIDVRGHTRTISSEGTSEEPVEPKKRVGLTMAEWKLAVDALEAFAVDPDMDPNDSSERGHAQELADRLTTEVFG